MSRRTSVRRFIPLFKATALQAVVVYVRLGGGALLELSANSDVPTHQENAMVGIEQIYHGRKETSRLEREW